MKLKFKNQDFQEAATAAVCDVFEGQPYRDPNVYMVDPGRRVEDNAPYHSGATSVSLPGFETLQQATLELPDDPPDVGYKNAEIALSYEALCKNLHAVQDRQNLEHSGGGGHGVTALPELEVEMETGTGKTFVYTKTIFELNKRGKEVVRTEKHVITEMEAKAINKWLYKNDFIDDADNVLPAWREARDNGNVPELPPLATNKNFAKDEFKELWKRINHKAAYKGHAVPCRLQEGRIV